MAFELPFAELFGAQFPWLEFTALAIAFGINAVVPGPDFAMVLRQSIVHGRRTAILTSLGISSAILVHGTYTLLGIGLIVSQSLLLFSILKIAGALYLLYLGISTFRSAPPVKPDFEGEKQSDQPSALSAFAIGFLTNLLNPKAVLFFLALFSTIVSATTVFEVKVIYVATMSFELFAWYLLVSIFFTTPKVRGAFYKIGKWFNRVTGAALVMLAVRVATSRQ